MSAQWLIGVFLSSNVILLLVQELIGVLKEEHKKKKKKGVEARLTEIEGSLDKLEQTDLVLLHDRIWQAFRFFEDKDEISTEDKVNIDYLYTEYKNKGGNHKAEVMYDYIAKIPLAPRTEKGELEHGMDN